MGGRVGGLGLVPDGSGGGVILFLSAGSPNGSGGFSLSTGPPNAFGRFVYFFKVLICPTGLVFWLSTGPPNASGRFVDFCKVLICPTGLGGFSFFQVLVRLTGRGGLA